MFALWETEWSSIREENSAIGMGSYWFQSAMAWSLSQSWNPSPTARNYAIFLKDLKLSRLTSLLAKPTASFRAKWSCRTHYFAFWLNSYQGSAEIFHSWSCSPFHIFHIIRYSFEWRHSSGGCRDLFPFWGWRVKKRFEYTLQETNRLWWYH